MKRYFADPTGARLLRIYYDYSCGLSEYVLKRDPSMAMSTLFFHDRYEILLLLL